MGGEGREEREERRRRKRAGREIKRWKRKGVVETLKECGHNNENHIPPS